MENNELKKQAINGAIWKGMEKVGIQVAQFVIQIVLARLLMPEDYGIIGLVTIFIAIADVFLQQGLPTALIQKKSVDERDYSSVFYANIFVSILLYIILWFLAPVVAFFYEDNNLILVLRVLGVTVPIGAFCSVHNAILAKKLEFKKSFYRGMFSIGAQGVVGVVLASKGYGVWALVFSKIMGTLIGTIVLFLSVNWKPKLVFSMERVQSLFAYGSKILGTNLLNTIFNNIHSLIIGKYFSKSDLGFYQRGQQIPQTIMTAIDGSMNEVLYPTLSYVQEDIVKLKGILRRSLKISIFIVLPIMMGVLATSKALVMILLTEKWIACVPYMQLTCVICSFWPFTSRNQALNAIGRSDVTFKISIISKSATIILILLCIKQGMYAIMLGTIISSFVGFMVTSYYTYKFLNYSYKELAVDCMPTFFLSIIMCVFVLGVRFFRLNVYLELIIQVVLGIAIYVIGAKLLKIDSFQYVIRLCKDIIGRCGKNEHC